MEDIRMLVGKRIKSLRKQINISQEKLAFGANIDRTYLASVENGKRNISIINIERIALALGYTLADFFDSEEFKINLPADYLLVAEKFFDEKKYK